MNKKIKIIELLNKIANGEEVPKRVKYGGIIYAYQIDNKHCLRYEDIEEKDLFWHYLATNISDLNETVEILEDNTEEIEEKSNFENMGYEIAQAYFEFYKGIAKALTEKRKESEDKQ